MHGDAPESGYIRRLDPDWIETRADVANLKEQLQELQRSNFRQERYLVGGWSEDGSAWISGVREKVDDMCKRFAWATAALWALFLIVAGDVAVKVFTR